MESLPSHILRCRAAVAGLACWLVVCLAGCDQQARQAARKSKLAAAGPEESFNWILQRVKTHLEQGPRQSLGGLGSDEENEVNRFSFQDEVTGDLIQPEKEDGPYRAKIVIRTRSNYVYTQTVQEKADRQRKNNEEDDSSPSLLDEELAGSGLSEDFLLDPQFALPLSLDPHGEASASALPGAKSGSNTGTANRGGRKDTRTLEDDKKEYYDLVYENGRWVLETEVEKESIRRIFENALESQ